MPAETKQQIHAVQKRLETGCRFIDAHPRWVPPGNLHITLVFLGEVEEEQIPELAVIAEKVGAHNAPFELELTRIDLFPPNSKQPRVISVGLGGEKRILSRLQESLAQQVAASGFTLDERSYKPHITLARLPSVKTASRVQSVVAAHANALQVKFHVNNIVLFESVSKPGGPEYVPLHSATLSG